MSTLPIPVPQEAFLLFDRADDAAVLAKIQGATLKECVYQFKNMGQDVYGISVDGYEECKRELAKRQEVIEECSIQIESQTAEYALFQAKAKRWHVNPSTGQRVELDSSIGLKRQPKFITRRNGELETNSFWYEMGGRKAMRNAGLSLIPESLQQWLIEKYKGTAKKVVMDEATGEVLTHEANASFKEKEERDRLVLDLKARWRDELQLGQEQVKKILRGKGLPETLARYDAAWAGVDLAVIRDLLAEAS